MLFLSIPSCLRPQRQTGRPDRPCVHSEWESGLSRRLQAFRRGAFTVVAEAVVRVRHFAAVSLWKKRGIRKAGRGGRGARFPRRSGRLNQTRRSRRASTLNSIQSLHYSDKTMHDFFFSFAARRVRRVSKSGTRLLGHCRKASDIGGKKRTGSRQKDA